MDVEKFVKWCEDKITEAISRKDFVSADNYKTLKQFWESKKC